MPHILCGMRWCFRQLIMTHSVSLSQLSFLPWLCQPQKKHLILNTKISQMWKPCFKNTQPCLRSWEGHGGINPSRRYKIWVQYPSFESNILLTYNVFIEILHGEYNVVSSLQSWLIPCGVSSASISPCSSITTSATSNNTYSISKNYIYKSRLDNSWAVVPVLMLPFAPISVSANRRIESWIL